MTITGAIVLFAVIWFLALLVALPIGLETHGDRGETGADHPASSPVEPQVRKKMIRVTVITIILWIPLCLLIASGWIGIEDLDFWHRM